MASHRTPVGPHGSRERYDALCQAYAAQIHGERPDHEAARKVCGVRYDAARNAWIKGWPKYDWAPPISAKYNAEVAMQQTGIARQKITLAHSQTIAVAEQARKAQEQLVEITAGVVESMRGLMPEIQEMALSLATDTKMLEDPTEKREFIEWFVKTTERLGSMQATQVETAVLAKGFARSRTDDYSMDDMRRELAQMEEDERVRREAAARRATTIVSSERVS